MKRSCWRFTESTFDYMANLYKADPKVFEQIKRAEINREIEDAKPRSRLLLRRFQFRIELAIAKEKNDYEEFERIVRAEIERIINDADSKFQARLRGLQFKIDATLLKYKNPIARMNKMAELFWEGVDTFEKTLRGELTGSKLKTSAKVISLFSNVNK